MYRAADVAFDPAFGELIGNLMRVQHGPGKSVEFGHGKGAAGAAGCQRLTKARAVPVAAG